jgi:hypothetical protein
MALLFLYNCKYTITGYKKRTRIQSIYLDKQKKI